MSLTPTSATVNEGNAAQTTIALAPSGGFTGTIALSCSGLPKYTICTFDPASVTSDGTHTVTTVLSIQTNVDTARLVRPLFPGQGAANRVALAAMGGGGLLGFLILRSRRRTRKLWSVWLEMVMALLISAVVIVCGGSSPSTPQGTSQITITATGGSTTHSVTYSLAVQ